MKILGAGAFGKVYMVKKKVDDKVYAMKALKKRDLIIKKQLRYAVTEVNVLKRCNHPFVLTLHYAFQVFYTKEIVFLKEIFLSDTSICLHGSGLLSKRRFGFISRPKGFIKRGRSSFFPL